MSQRDVSCDIIIRRHLGLGPIELLINPYYRNKESLGNKVGTLLRHTGMTLALNILGLKIYNYCDLLQESHGSDCLRLRDCLMGDEIHVSDWSFRPILRTGLLVWAMMQGALGEEAKVKNGFLLLDEP